MEKELLYKEEAYKIIGAAMAVHKELGSGMHEKVYGDALKVEFEREGIPFERERQFRLKYKGVVLEHGYVCDFLCYGKIIVEIKSVKELEDIHRSQIINYLKFSGMQLGLLLNFGSSSLQKERYVNSRGTYYSK